MINLEHLTGEVCKIAIEGGKYLAEERKTFNRDKVEQKRAHDYVSYVDKEAEKLLVRKLSSLFPEAGFITEENTVQFEEKDYYWIIDPLDGTTNYIHDYAPYCVSIALSYKSELLIGVVYEVCRDECFYAWKGGKAFMNGERIHISDIDIIDNAFIGLDLPYNDKEFKPVVGYLFDNLYGRAASIRICGSAAMAMCYVAIGRYDVWAEAFLKLWDIAAAALIVREAGGNVTDFMNNADIWNKHHVVVSNNSLHNDMLELLAPFTEGL